MTAQWLTRRLWGKQGRTSLSDSLLAKLIVAAIKSLPGSPNLADLAPTPASAKAAAKPSSKDAKSQVCRSGLHTCLAMLFSEAGSNAVKSYHTCRPQMQHSS